MKRGEATLNILMDVRVFIIAQLATRSIEGDSISLDAGGCVLNRLDGVREFEANGGVLILRGPTDSLLGNRPKGSENEAKRKANLTLFAGEAGWRTTSNFDESHRN